MSDEQRAVIVARARQCIGTRFLWQGRQPGIGLDCIGLVLFACDDPALRALDRPDYALASDPGELDAALACLDGSRRNTARPGDLVVLAVRGRPHHLAIRSPDGLIHADMVVRRVVEHRFDASWAQRVRSIHSLCGD